MTTPATGPCQQAAPSRPPAEEAQRLLALGGTVVVDASFSTEEQRDLLRSAGPLPPAAGKVQPAGKDLWQELSCAQWWVTGCMCAAGLSVSTIRRPRSSRSGDRTGLRRTWSVTTASVRRSCFLVPTRRWNARRVFHRRVGTRKHERLTLAVVTDQVRRSPVLSPDLDDLGRLIVLTDNPAAHMQPVTHHCAHDNSSHRSLPAGCTFPAAGGRGPAVAGSWRDRCRRRVLHHRGAA